MYMKQSQKKQNKKNQPQDFVKMFVLKRVKMTWIEGQRRKKKTLLQNQY